MTMFSTAKFGLGGVKIPVMLEMEQNMLFQKLVKCLQVQNIWRRLPTVPQFLQHNGELIWLNLGSL